MKTSTTVPSRFAVGVTATLVALAGCGYSPMVVGAIAPTTMAVTLDCAKSEMVALKYDVTIDSVTRGWFGDRAGAQHGFTYEGNVVHDRLSVWVVGTDSTPHGLHITASTQHINTFLNRHQTQTIKTSDTVKADAMHILTKCTRDVGPARLP